MGPAGASPSLEDPTAGRALPGQWGRRMSVAERPGRRAGRPPVPARPRRRRRRRPRRERSVGHGAPAPGAALPDREVQWEHRGRAPRRPTAPLLPLPHRSLRRLGRCSRPPDRCRSIRRRSVRRRSVRCRSVRQGSVRQGSVGWSSARRRSLRERPRRRCLRARIGGRWHQRPAPPRCRRPESHPVAPRPAAGAPSGPRGGRGGRPRPRRPPPSPRRCAGNHR